MVREIDGEFGETMATGENVVREKYGEIFLNPSLYTSHKNPEYGSIS